MKYLFYRLIIFLDTANENDTNYNIAWYMANNFKKVAVIKICRKIDDAFLMLLPYYDTICTYKMVLFIRRKINFVWFLFCRNIGGSYDRNYL